MLLAILMKRDCRKSHDRKFLFVAGFFCWLYKLSTITAKACQSDGKGKV
jgi:hypothetical protein